MKLKYLNKDYLVDKETTNCYHIDNSVVKQWLSEGNTPEPEFTEEELAKQELDREVAEAKAYLTDTGWIWEKYNRNVLVLKDMTNEEFNLKYTDVISKQEEYRLLINELEVQLEVTNG